MGRIIYNDISVKWSDYWKYAQRFRENGPVGRYTENCKSLFNVAENCRFRGKSLISRLASRDRPTSIV